MGNDSIPYFRPTNVSLAIRPKVPEDTVTTEKPKAARTKFLGFKQAFIDNANNNPNGKQAGIAGLQGFITNRCDVPYNENGSNTPVNVCDEARAALGFLKSGGTPPAP